MYSSDTKETTYIDLVKDLSGFLFEILGKIFKQIVVVVFVFLLMGLFCFFEWLPITIYVETTWDSTKTGTLQPAITILTNIFGALFTFVFACFLTYYWGVCVFGKKDGKIFESIWLSKWWKKILFILYFTLTIIMNIYLIVRIGDLPNSHPDYQELSTLGGLNVNLLVIRLYILGIGIVGMIWYRISNKEKKSETKNSNPRSTNSLGSNSLGSNNDSKQGNYQTKRKPKKATLIAREEPDPKPQVKARLLGVSDGKKSKLLNFFIFLDKLRINANFLQIFQIDIT